MAEIKQLKKAIKQLSEDEAKSMLFPTLINKQSRDSIQQFLLQQTEEPSVSAKQTVHIVFGDSPGGSLKAAFRNTSYNKTDEVIVIPGNFSIGPLKAIHTAAGIEARFQWLQERYSMNTDDLELVQRQTMEAIEHIKNSPPHLDIIIWTCQNAHEQIGLRLILAILEDNINDIYVFDTFQLFHEMYTYPQLVEEHYPRSSGEVRAEDLLYFYEHYQERPVKTALRQTLCQEGLHMLVDDFHCIHTWEYHELWHSNDEAKDDALIIACAKRLHHEQERHDYQHTARIVGEVLGHMEQYREAEWIEYRIQQLIQQGVFSYQGELKGMLLYQVKLSDAYMV
ncbi:DUF1835 domain-containing protein [Lysinibacillus sp. FSL K6-0232]|uniref:DUF1835 domain-containing protein n=1 Tax=Lysinibacillus sp. FSL K6-0232 TaxID=2921425 RepID=UPI0030FB2479